MTQTERIVQYLSDNGSITAAEAMTELGIYRLASRIHDLRKAGYAINRRIVSDVNRYGEPVHYTRYSLD
mgnify:CR=1 FL=1